MFDDQPTNNNRQVPPNLPLDEPEDMFAPTDIGGDRSPETTGAPDEPSALEAGVLRPKIAPQPAASHISSNSAAREAVPPLAFTPPNYQVLPPELDQRDTMNSPITSEPALTRRGLTGLITVAVLLILGGGGAWVYVKFVRGSEEKVTPVIEIQKPTPTSVSTPLESVNQPVVQLELPLTPGLANPPTSSPTVDDKILFGEPVDTDSDGLDDVREADLKTDPLNWDTDSDQLGDGDEVISWKSDPLNPDTDKDTYPDGQEVKNGYNPTGPGKIFDPNASATAPQP